MHSACCEITVCDPAHYMTFKVLPCSPFAKILYCSPAWSVLISASDRSRIDAFLKISKRLGYCAAYRQNVDCCKSFITIFYFCCFRCVIVPLTGLINYVFCIYICCFIANFGHRTRLDSKQSHSHRAYIIIFSFLFVAVET